MVTNHQILNVKKKNSIFYSGRKYISPQTDVWSSRKFITVIENHSFFPSCISKWEKKKKDSKGSQQTKALFPLLLPGSRLQGLVFYTKWIHLWLMAQHTALPQTWETHCIFPFLNVSKNGVKCYTSQPKAWDTVIWKI